MVKPGVLTKAVLQQRINWPLLSENLRGDPEGTFRGATAKLAHESTRIPGKPPRPNAEACGDPCLNITVLIIGSGTTESSKRVFLVASDRLRQQTPEILALRGVISYRP